jgi:hypothetical protein
MAFGLNMFNTTYPAQSSFVGSVVKNCPYNPSPGLASLGALGYRVLSERFRIECG